MDRLKLIEKFAKQFVPELAADNVGDVAAEAAGPGAGSDRFGEFFGHGDAYLAYSAGVEAAGFLDEDACWEHGHDALHHLIAGDRTEGLAESLLERAQFRRDLTLIARSDIFGSHKKMLPAVAS